MNIRGFLGATALLFLSGCTVGPDYHPTVPPVGCNWVSTESPAVYKGDPDTPLVWWGCFHDPVLTSLIEDALAQNLDIEAAGLRVVQARSEKSRAKWLLLPAVRGEGGFSHANLSQSVKPDVEITPGSLGPILGQLPDPNVKLPTVSIADEVDVYSAGAMALWEPDIWGSTRRNIRKLSAKHEAAVASYDNVVVLIAAEVASTYIQYRTVEARIAALNENANLLKKLASSSGEGDRAEGNRALAESLRGETLARIVDLKTARQQYEHALCALLGCLPGTMGDRLSKGSSKIPVPASKLAIGIPADLLRRRPDVREAERLAAAQSERIGITKARLFPQFALAGGLGLASSDSDTFTDSASKNGFYGVGVTWDILLYPFIQEKVRVEDARYQEAMVTFQNAVVKAASEAESALIAYVNARKKSNLLSKSATDAKSAASKRIDGAGESEASFDAAFTALENRLTQTDKSIAARGAQALSMVRLYAALGGGWEAQVGKSFVKEDAKAEMKSRTEWSTFGGKKRLNETR